MQTSQNGFSHGKSTKATQRFNDSPRPFIEQSNTLSLQFQDLRNLMKKKQKQYQNTLQIAQAQRVHNFLSEVQEKQKEQNLQDSRRTKNRLKKQVLQDYAINVKQFEKDWSERFAKTVEELQQIEDLLEAQHQEQQQKALKTIQQSKNGKTLHKMKHSKKTLQLQDQLRRLVKSKRYEEAFVVSNRYEKAKKSDIHQFITNSVDLSKKALSKLTKKQEKQKQMFADRLTEVYLKEKRRYQNQNELLMKNMKTYVIDMTKVQSKIQRLERQKLFFATTKRINFSETPSVMAIPKAYCKDSSVTSLEVKPQPESKKQQNEPEIVKVESTQKEKEEVEQKSS